ncbi:MAG: prenyltransferase [Candidatus Micrarchaeaceae archaeon]
MLKYYLLELLDPLVIITPLSSCVGIALAFQYARPSLAKILLLLVALALANMAVNTFNAYEDYKSGLDVEATRTKFSGGTLKASYLVSGKIKPRQALRLALFVFAIALATGVYFVISVPLLLPIVAIGAVTILLYTKSILKVPFLAESLLVIIYMLVPIGAFVALTGIASHLLRVFFVSFPVGALVSMVLLMNEVPDVQVDKKHGRKSMAVMAYNTGTIGSIYLVIQLLGVLVLVLGALSGLTPAASLLALLALPFMLAAYAGIRKYENPKQFEKYMGFNVIYFFLFLVLLIAGIAIRSL